MVYTGPALAVNEYAFMTTLLLSLYGYPYVAQQQFMMNDLVRLDLDFNQVYYSNGTANPWYAPFPGPNVDTLYGRAYLDLTNTLVELTLPDTRNLDLWWCVTLTDASSEIQSILPGSNKNQKSRTYLLVGPNFENNNLLVSNSYKIIRCPTNIMVLFIRVGIKNNDLTTSFNVLHGITINTVTSNADVLDISTFDNSVYTNMNFYSILSEILQYNPPDVSEQVLLDIFASQNSNFKLPFVPPVSGSVVENGYLTAINFTYNNFLPFGYQWGTGLIRVNGWQAPTKVARYGDDYARRAYSFYAKAIFPNVVEEQFYPAAFNDVNGNVLNAALHNYTLYIPEQYMPQVDPTFGMITLTMYDAITFTLVDNPINRYAFGTNSGNFYDDGGNTATFYFSHYAPDDPLKYARWLPAPNGPFWVNLRAYQATSNTIYNFYLPGIVISDN
jgi:hypothetical protein